jgi:hypothetical protein
MIMVEYQPIEMRGWKALDSSWLDLEEEDDCKTYHVNVQHSNTKPCGECQTSGFYSQKCRSGAHLPCLSNFESRLQEIKVYGTNSPTEKGESEDDISTDEEGIKDDIESEETVKREEER